MFVKVIKDFKQSLFETVNFYSKKILMCVL